MSGITYVQSRSFHPSPPTAPPAFFTTKVAVGDLLIAVSIIGNNISIPKALPITISDTVNSGYWTSLVADLDSNFQATMSYIQCTAAGPLGLRINELIGNTDFNNTFWAVGHYTGFVGLALPASGNITGIFNNVTSPPIVGTPFNTSESNELAIAFVNNRSGGTFTTPSPWTIRENSDVSTLLFDQVNIPTLGTTVSFSATNSISAASIVVLAGFYDQPIPTRFGTPRRRFKQGGNTMGLLLPEWY